MEKLLEHAQSVADAYRAAAIGDPAKLLITADQIGDILSLEPRTVRVKAVKDPDFPKPIKIGATDKGAKHAPSRWLLSEVLDYLERCKAARPQKIAA